MSLTFKHVEQALPADLYQKIVQMKCKKDDEERQHYACKLIDAFNRLLMSPYAEIERVDTTAKECMTVTTTDAYGGITHRTYECKVKQKPLYRKALDQIILVITWIRYLVENILHFFILQNSDMIRNLCMV
jgi:hypothetical protein